VFLKRRLDNRERLSESSHKISQDGFAQDTWAGEGGWRLIHRILGSIVLILGIINISLGVFLAVLPLAVWVIWYIYMSILVIVLIIMEIVAIRRSSAGGKGGSLKLPGKKIEEEIFISKTKTILSYNTERRIEYTIYDNNSELIFRNVFCV
jgi:hypothetical protein